MLATLARRRTGRGRVAAADRGPVPAPAERRDADRDRARAPDRAAGSVRRPAVGRADPRRASSPRRWSCPTSWLERSGLNRLRLVLTRQFEQRSRVLKARSSLAVLSDVLRGGGCADGDVLLAAAEQLSASTHEFEEVRLLSALRVGSIEVRPDRVAELDRLLGGNGHSAAARLGPGRGRDRRRDPPDRPGVVGDLAAAGRAPAVGATGQGRCARRHQDPRRHGRGAQLGVP